MGSLFPLLFAYHLMEMREREERKNEGKLHGYVGYRPVFCIATDDAWATLATL
jgi:hypothetical protein